MDQKTYILASGVIFLLLAVGHLIRAVSGWDAVINGFEVPVGLSWLVFVVGGFFAYTALHKHRH